MRTLKSLDMLGFVENRNHMFSGLGKDFGRYAMSNGFDRWRCIGVRGRIGLLVNHLGLCSEVVESGQPLPRIVVYSEGMEGLCDGAKA